MLRLGTFAADVLALLAGTASKVIAHATIDSTVIGGTTPSTATFTTLSLTGSQSQAVVLAAPLGGAGAPTFRLLALSDIPGAAPLASPSFSGVVSLPAATFGATQGAKISLYGALGAATTYGMGINAAELALWTGGSFTLRNSTTAAGLSAPILFQVTASGLATFNMAIGGGSGSVTVNNPYTTAGTAAAFTAVTGTANASLTLNLIDGGTPTAYITAGSGVTGGLMINPAAGGVTINPASGGVTIPTPLTVSSTSFGATAGAKISLYGALGAANSYGMGINAAELALWTGGSFTLRNSTTAPGLTAPITFQVGSSGSATHTANVSGGNGSLTLNNPNTATGTAASFQAVTGTTNAYTSLVTTDGTTPTGYVTTGAGVTGGLVLQPGALGVTINDPNASGTQTLALSANGNGNGSNLKFIGNGATTPSKTIRALNGALEFINSAYTLRIAALTDAGAFTATQSLNSPSVFVSGGLNPYSSSVAWSGTANGISAFNTTTGTTNTGTNYVSVVAGTGTQMQHALFSYYNGSTYTQIGSISSTTTTTAYNTTSDYRIKEDVQPLRGNRSRIMALRPCSFIFKTDPARLPHQGFIAHEFADAMPDAHAVTGDKDGVVTFTDVVMSGPGPVATGVSEAAWALGVAAGTYPAVSQWHARLTVPVHQALDASKCIPDLVATVQGLVRQVNALSTRLAALSTQATVRSLPLPPPPSNAAPEEDS